MKRILFLSMSLFCFSTQCSEATEPIADHITSSMPNASTIINKYIIQYNLTNCIVTLGNPTPLTGQFYKADFIVFIRKCLNFFMLNKTENNTLFLDSMPAEDCKNMFLRCHDATETISSDKITEIISEIPTELWKVFLYKFYNIIQHENNNIYLNQENVQSILQAAKDCNMPLYNYLVNSLKTLMPLLFCITVQNQNQNEEKDIQLIFE